MAEPRKPEPPSKGERKAVERESDERLPGEGPEPVVEKEPPQGEGDTGLDGFK